MSYLSGTAVNFSALRTALIGAAEAEGWTWNSGSQVLSRDDLFIRITIESNHIALLGRTSATSGDAPRTVCFAAPVGDTLQWPLAYELFVFPDEIFLVASYNIEKYVWLAFGKSRLPGIQGSGLWLGATLGEFNTVSLIYMTAIEGGYSTGGGERACPGLFWATRWGFGGAHAPAINCLIHHDLDGAGWSLQGAAGGQPVGIAAATPLVSLLPNSWNSEAVLLPLRCYIPRLESKISLVAELDNARITRIDHYTPGQIVSIGDERWKVFPWFRKDSSAPTGGFNIQHTGCLGWAIRYEGA